MYSKRTVELKSDFYSRFGETRGTLYFEKTGLPCKIFDGGDDFMAFSLGCGVRACGRDYGDILRVMDSDTNVCDVHFVRSGRGAQILYKKDIGDMDEMSATAVYTINKLLRKMGCDDRISKEEGLEAVCDRYGNDGWCAVKMNGQFGSVPLPLSGYNVILIRTRNRRIRADDETMQLFHGQERERMRGVCEELRECGLDAFFNEINKSQSSIERIFKHSQELTAAAESARNGEGVVAVKICDSGVIAFVNKSDTDRAVHRIISECRVRLGYSVRVAVVK